jgi:hypothetical protein
MFRVKASAAPGRASGDAEHTHTGLGGGTGHAAVALGGGAGHAPVALGGGAGYAPVALGGGVGPAVPVWTYLPPGEDDLDNGCLRSGCVGRLTDANVCDRCGRQYQFIEKKGWRYCDIPVSFIHSILYFLLVCLCLFVWTYLVLCLCAR